MKRIVRRRTEIIIETHEVTTVRRSSADVVAYAQPDETEIEPADVLINARNPDEDNGNAAEEGPA